MRSALALGIVAFVSALAPGAAADAIGGGPDWPCAPGTRFVEDHGGPRCEAFDCSGDRTCPDGLVCRDALALFPEPGSPPPYPIMRPVRGACDCPIERCVPNRWCVPPDAETLECPGATLPPPARTAGHCAAGRASSAWTALLGVALLTALLRRRAR